MQSPYGRLCRPAPPQDPADYRAPPVTNFELCIDFGLDIGIVDDPEAQLEAALHMLTLDAGVEEEEAAHGFSLSE